MSEQQSLFSASELSDIQRPGVKTRPSLTMGCEALDAWKTRIYRFQQRTLATLGQPQQRSLLAAETAGDSVTDLDPFALPQQNTEFWRWAVSEAGTAALYFVIDAELPLLLYIGETGTANTRWKGEHDCKRYLMNYVDLHRRYDRAVAARIGFWHEAPSGVYARQALEKQLIQQWRSPFNKENWKHWGTPFLGNKRR